MTSVEIANYFRNHTSNNICGRFKKHQLTTYTESRKSQFNVLGAITIAFMALFSFAKTHAQNIDNQTRNSINNTSKLQSAINDNSIIVKGIVSESGNPLPGANILLEGTAIGISTDFDGNFEFPVLLKKGDVLVFSYIGFTSKKVKIQDNTSGNNIALNVNLKPDGCVLMGKVAVKKLYSSTKD
ncbi:hypothetical protein GCM10009430_29490 [Aquimarina litoralis]|uniref:CarboxypepD_reg-like domain-containing protein n=2 Tax=Aquimarina litoralis TaxID=584605 RepID=A0ABP3U9I3_9FLAO